MYICKYALILENLVSTFFPEGLAVDRSSDDAVVEVNVNANVVPGASQSYTTCQTPLLSL